MMIAVLGWVLLVLAARVTSQGLKLPEGQRWMRRNPKCGSSSTCTPLRRCPSLRNELDWMEMAETCGRNRRGVQVCCPNEPQIQPPVRQSPNEPQTQPPVRQTRPRPPPRRVEDITTASACGTEPQMRSGRLMRNPLVMGGEEVPEGLYPWMVALLKRRRRGGGEDFECTGFLIDSNHVLTAAHCFNPVEPSRYSLRVGNVNWREGQAYQVAKIDIPEGYRRGMYYDDLALLTTDRPVRESNVMPICLPTGPLATMDLTGMGTTVAGWGAEFHLGSISDVLQHLNAIPVLSNRDCNRRLSRNLAGFERQFNRGITRTFICAGFMEGGKDSCGGDSGGPLMLKQEGVWYAVGIVSFGYECGRPGYPAGYTRISEYLDYIRRHTS